MPPTDTVPLLHLLAQQTLTDAFARWAGHYAHVLVNGDAVVPPENGIDPTYTGTDLVRELRDAARGAHAYYVSPDMQAVVTAALSTMPADPVTAEDFPTQQGFMWLPDGHVVVDALGAPCVTRAYLWSVHGGAAHVHALADKEHPLDSARGQAHLPRLTPWHQGRLTFGQPLPQALAGVRVLPPEVARGSRLQRVGDGAVLALPDGATDIPPPVFGPDPVLGWLVAALRLMAQPLAALHRQGLPAHVRDDLRRGKVKLKDTSVTVVEFRRREHGFDTPGSGREFTHRFLRRGHWRQQPYKNTAGQWARKVIWILPTIVGPPDKPLVVRDRVNALVR